jgi:hypothetical protein
MIMMGVLEFIVTLMIHPISLRQLKFTLLELEAVDRVGIVVIPLGLIIVEQVLPVVAERRLI